MARKNIFSASKKATIDEYFDVIILLFFASIVIIGLYITLFSFSDSPVANEMKTTVDAYEMLNVFLMSKISGFIDIDKLYNEKEITAEEKAIIKDMNFAEYYAWLYNERTKRNEKKFLSVETRRAQDEFFWRFLKNGFFVTVGVTNKVHYNLAKIDTTTKYPFYEVYVPSYDGKIIYIRLPVNEN